MAATFAFLHNLAAFPVVSTLAVQFVRLRDEVTLGLIILTRDTLKPASAGPPG